MRENKIFKTGILVGRFQHIHKGHEKLINIGLNLCDRLLVFIGSCDSKLCDKNPYDFSYRKYLIEKIYGDVIKEEKLIIQPLKDFEDPTELTYEWGKYVIQNAEEILGKKVECIIYGKDKNIFKCFAKSTVKNMTEILVDRNNYEISATQMRKYLLENNQIEWKKFADPSIYDEYENLRKCILNVMNKGEI